MKKKGCALKQKNWKFLIKAVAEECGYMTSDFDKSIEIYTKYEHPISFSIKENSEGYLQVHMWEDSVDEDEHKYGKARYSLRSAMDVVSFCNILSTSIAIRARR